MCVTVILLYMIGQGNAGNSLVSPRTVFEVRDDLELFEIAEKKIIMESLAEAKEGFGTNQFAEELRGIFLRKIKSSESKEFIFKNLTRETKVREQSDVFLDSIYSVDVSGDKVILSRSTLEKNYFLKAENRENKIHFPVEFSFSFERKYLISLEDNKYKVEEVEE